MAVFDWMANLAIDAAGGKRKVFGSKPGVAEFVPTDLGTEAGRAVDANLANSDKTRALLDKLMPGWSEMQAQGGKNTLSLLKGELPKDVSEAVLRNSAYKSLMGGYSGSGMSRNLVGRDLGLTSLGLMEKGENSAQRWSAITQESFAPYLVTARDQAAQTEKNNLYKQAVEQFRFNVEAAPDPGAAGLFNTIAVIGGTAASFGTMGMGGGSRTAAAPSGGGYGRYGGG